MVYVTKYLIYANLLSIVQVSIEILRRLRVESFNRNVCFDLLHVIQSCNVVAIS
jgi:hypothetical protein